jgi:hypothetical protein
MFEPLEKESAKSFDLDLFSHNARYTNQVCKHARLLLNLQKDKLILEWIPIKAKNK